MIINANALHIPLADQSVHCIVTSPPYWALRDYGTAKWEGGEVGCDHKPNVNSRVTRERNGLTGSLEYMQAQEPNYRDICGKCGAIRIDNQLGLERTPEEYVSNMVAVFRECWRVLRDDGTLWLNIGDSYNGGGTHHGNNNTGLSQSAKRQQFEATNVVDGLKPKDLVGIPWRLAFALQADGWYLRSDIIWSKPNPMPESVTDRPTKAHEYLFLLTKRERYYYDNEAVREENADPDRTDYTPGKRAYTIGNNPGVDGDDRPLRNDGFLAYKNGKTCNGRNRRTVWTIPTAPYKGAHFATFPPALVEPCIKAGTSERGVCPKCGKGWRRVVEKESHYEKRQDRAQPAGVMAQVDSSGWSEPDSKFLGWKPSCLCYGIVVIPKQPKDKDLLDLWREKWEYLKPIYDSLESIPALVFDPFVGSGTTVKVAYDLGRRGVGLDLSLQYLDEQATTRIHNGHVGRLV